VLQDDFDENDVQVEDIVGRRRNTSNERDKHRQVLLLPRTAGSPEAGKP
jgi:hypothetical protein